MFYPSTPRCRLPLRLPFSEIQFRIKGNGTSVKITASPSFPLSGQQERLQTTVTLYVTTSYTNHCANILKHGNFTGLLLWSEKHLTINSASNLFCWQEWERELFNSQKRVVRSWRRQGKQITLKIIFMKTSRWLAHPARQVFLRGWWTLKQPPPPALPRHPAVWSAARDWQRRLLI